MSVTLYAYPNCSTCKKAEKWLKDNNITYNYVHIVEDPPSEQEILTLIEKSGLQGRRFFNTSGKVYRELKLKDVVPQATVEEMAELLASNGMLIKRPIVTNGEKVTVGFNEETLSDAWL
ncbi:MAG TPA: arsenate reductase family protein [Bacillota bacterium]|nr:arsenate reductase family protein [Bacillota bacterium]